MLACPRCAARGQAWPGDPPRCAFASGFFSSDNWNCATANALRDAIKEPLWNEDQWTGSLSVPESDEEPSGRFIVLGWYKSRGRVEAACVLHGSDWGRLSLRDAELALSGVAARLRGGR